VDLAATAAPRIEAIPDLPHALADEGLVLRRAARRAEDGGHVVGARRLVRLLPAEPDQRRWLRSLDEAVALGPAPEPGSLALWLLQPALRFGLASLRAGAVRLLVAEVLRTRGEAGSRAHGGDRGLAQAFTPGAILDDPLLADAALFDAGLLEAYVQSALEPTVRDRAAPLAEWPKAEVSVFKVSTGDGHLLARDLRDGHELRVHGEPAVPPLVYGRPVPWPAEPGARFVLPPLALDRLSARRVLRAITRRAPVEERLRAVAAHQRRSGSGSAAGSPGESRA